MHWIEIAMWIRAEDPKGCMSIVQHEMVKSALARDDVKTARRYIADFASHGKKR